MAYLLDPYTILLGCECECHKCCCLKVRFHGYYHKYAEDIAEGDVFKTEGCAVQFGSHVLSRAKEEEGHTYNHVALYTEDGFVRSIGND